MDCEIKILLLHVSYYKKNVW